MNSFNPSDPDFKNRVLSSFNNQGVMNTIGARIITIAPGKVEIDFGFHESLTQQHGYIHTCRNVYMPKVFQHEDRDTFEANQRRDVLHKAQAVYEDILQRLPPDAVPTGEQLKEIEQIVQAADAEIVG